MASINLSTSEVKRESALSLNNGNLILFGILVLVLLGYGALFLINSNLDKGISQKNDEISADLLLFSSENAKSIMDYQNRLDMTRDLLKKGSNNVDFLIMLERAIVPGVVIDSYVFSDESGSITLNCLADNYEVIAKQVMSLKTKNEFSSVFAGSSSFDSEQNKIKIEIILKNK